MATLAQLKAEPVWGAQATPPAILGLKRRLEAAGITVYVAGDTAHVKGRHRSRAWCLTSKFCTNRSYGTRDARDLAGDANWYRAVDIMLEGPRLWAVCRRVDAAVRAGELPGLAEWFGTFDGKTVSGWFEGRPGSSDTSHLTHFHGGFWTGSANDTATMDRLFALITGTEEEDMTPAQDTEAYINAWRTYGLQNMQDPIVIPANQARGVKVAISEPNFLARAIKAMATGGSAVALEVTLTGTATPKAE